MASELFRKIGEKEVYVVRDNEGRIVVSDELLNVLLDNSEKQIPKKPYQDINNCDFWTCPNCNKEIYWDTDYGQQKFKHCTECGQKLDWETDF